jgi:hypothetical protein
VLTCQPALTQQLQLQLVLLALLVFVVSGHPPHAPLTPLHPPCLLQLLKQGVVPALPQCLQPSPEGSGHMLGVGHLACWLARALGSGVT